MSKSSRWLPRRAKELAKTEAGLQAARSHQPKEAATSLNTEVVHTAKVLPQQAKEPAKTEVIHAAKVLPQQAKEPAKMEAVQAARVLLCRAKVPATSLKMAAVQAVADSTQERRKSTRLRKRKTPEPDSSEDSDQVSGSRIRRKTKTPRRVVRSDKWVPKQRGPITKMGRQIPLTFTARGKALCKVVTQAECSNVSPSKTTVASEDGGHSEDNNILMREWLELKANKGDLHGLQWHDKSRKLVRISWKHGSKSGWTADDSQVFISWARCTGWQSSIASVFIITAAYFFLNIAIFKNLTFTLKH